MKPRAKILYWAIVIPLYIPANLVQWLDNVFTKLDVWLYKLEFPSNKGTKPDH